MAAKTRLLPEGYGGKRAGSFSGKTPAGGDPHPVGRICQFQVGAWCGRRYGSFAGRSSGSHPVGRITQLTAFGYGSRRYGSFASKTATAVGGIPAIIYSYKRRR